VKNATAAAATAKSTAESTAESTASAAVANASNVTTGSNGSAAPAISKRTAAEQGAEQITKQDNVMSRQESPKATPTFNKP
jgi:hypothetical protein